MKLDNFEVFGKFISPTWLSGLIAIVVGLALTLGVMAVFSFNNSAVLKQLKSWEQTQSQPSLTTANQTLPTPKLQLKNTWPLLIAWGLVGIIVYILTMAVVNSITNTAQLVESLGYVHTKPKAVLKATIERISLRVVAIIFFVVLFINFYKQIIPYSITAAQVSANNIKVVHSDLHVLLAFVIIVLSLHLETIFLRLARGRYRVFGD
jgi:hypothetical protein